MDFSSSSGSFDWTVLPFCEHTVVDGLKKALVHEKSIRKILTPQKPRKCVKSHLEALWTLAGGEVVAGDTLGVGAALLEPEAGVRAETRPTLLQHGT